MNQSAFSLMGSCRFSSVLQHEQARPQTDCTLSWGFTAVPQTTLTHWSDFHAT